MKKNAKQSYESVTMNSYFSITYKKSNVSKLKRYKTNMVPSISNRSTVHLTYE